MEQPTKNFKIAFVVIGLIISILVMIQKNQAPDKDPLSHNAPENIKQSLASKVSNTLKIAGGPWDYVPDMDDEYKTRSLASSIPRRKKTESGTKALCNNCDKTHSIKPSINDECTHYVHQPAKWIHILHFDRTMTHKKNPDYIPLPPPECNIHNYKEYIYKPGVHRWDLRGIDLSGAYLENANLEGAYLKGANLKGANLMGANLKNANLDEVNLQGAKLNGANLEWVECRGINLKNATLIKVKMHSASCSFSNMENANFKGGDLFYGTFCGSNMKGANFKNTDLRWNEMCLLSDDTQIKGATFTKAKVHYHLGDDLKSHGIRDYTANQDDRIRPEDYCEYHNDLEDDGSELTD